MRKIGQLGAMALLALVSFASCSKKEKSGTTGWNYNDQKWGGFEKKKYEGQATGPNLVLVEGGTFSMGATEQDVTFEWNNVARRVTVSSFYMDETEVANIDYREYLYWLNRTFGSDYPEVYKNALPDTLVWREELSYNEPYIENYFRYPSYDNYPVVGVSWLKANEYCKWRTDRVNEMILIERGIIQPPGKDGEAKANFNTEAYLAGKYQPNVRKNLKDLRTGQERQVQYEDGILLPSYRLPTEAEWEYAALGLKGNMASSQDERITERRIYPWNGNSVRYQKRNKNQGDILANFKKSGGDYMGLAGNLNDRASITSTVRSFMPNDFGLYNMAGNVSEWVQDVYRPMTSLDLRDADRHDLNSFRGNAFKKLKVDENGNPIEPDSLGRLQYEDVKDDELTNRDNVKRSKLYDYLDGDTTSNVTYDKRYTLISDKARVIKGGSWADRAYWLAPGSRRYKDEDKSDATIGFRCAMTRNGGSSGNGEQEGNQFKANKKKSSKKRKY